MFHGCRNLVDYTNWYNFVFEIITVTKAEKTKQFIIEKTAPVFNTKGYAGTSLSDLTEVTGLTKGSIYGNFVNKDEVALAAFDHNWKTVQNIVKGQMKGKATIREQLLVYVDVYEHFFSQPFPVGGCPILNTSIEADDTHPMLKKKAVEGIVQWKNSIVALIEKGIETKEFSTDVQAEEVAWGIIALIEGGIMIGKVTGKAAYKNSILKVIERMIKAI